MNLNFRKTLIPIVGIHAAGKSTLIDIFSSMGFSIEEELAEIIREREGMAVGANRTDNSLDYRLYQLETQRDRNRIWPKIGVIFIEGWHILNIAYLKTRSPNDQLINRYEDYVRDFLREKNSIFCIYLEMDPSNIAQRSQKIHSRSEAPTHYLFYQHLNENIIRTIKCLKIPYKKIRAEQPIENILSESISTLSSRFFGSAYPHKLCKNPPKYLRINITNACNHRCLFCHNEGESNTKKLRFLSASEIQMYSEAFKKIGIRKIKIIGGEPTVHPKLKKILYALSKVNFDDIALITNGHDIKKWLPIFEKTGIRRFNITIPSLDRKRAFRISGTKNQIDIQTIKYAIRKGFRIKINTIYLDKFSKEDILQLCEVFRETKIVIGILDPIPPCRIAIDPNWKENLLSNFNIVRKFTVNNFSLPTTRYEIEESLYLDFKTTAISNANVFRFCSICNMRQDCKEGIYALRITPGGLLRSCLLRDDNLFNIRMLLPLDKSSLAKILSFWVWSNVL